MKIYYYLFQFGKNEIEEKETEKGIESIKRTFNYHYYYYIENKNISKIDFNY